MGSAMLLLDRAMLSPVTIPLSVAVWPQFANASFDWVPTPNLPFLG